jgi:hypothetical protein
MAPRAHRPLKIVINENSIWRRLYELTDQLQDLHVEVALLSETRLKHHEWFFVPN